MAAVDMLHQLVDQVAAQWDQLGVPEPDRMQLVQQLSQEIMSGGMDPREGAGAPGGGMPPQGMSQMYGPPGR